MTTDLRVIGHSAKIIDLDLYRARKNPKRPLTGEALKERQRETIEKLRALGYEMSGGSVKARFAVFTVQGTR